ncbi:MAG TPA: class I SAM-dependent methyltransferase [Promineifilum sp.]|nr:class I SAM-dependent methyltransferase [Promineifilum sp.]
MDDTIVRRLVELNAQFYEQLADPFSASRAGPQPGYEQLLAYLPSMETLDVLDVGCGNGRFGRFLVERVASMNYTGVDFSDRLMSTADFVAGNFYRRDLSLSAALSGLGAYDLIVCLSTLQHIPGYTNRERLLREMRDHLRPHGRLVLANWQFLDNPRQRRKLRPWPEIGLQENQVEQGDYLLSWQKGGFGLRYVALIDEGATQSLAQFAGFRIIINFRSDGREGDLNLYTILASE